MRREGAQAAAQIGIHVNSLTTTQADISARIDSLDKRVQDMQVGAGVQSADVRPNRPQVQAGRLQQEGAAADGRTKLSPARVQAILTFGRHSSAWTVRPHSEPTSHGLLVATHTSWCTVVCLGLH